MICIKTAWDFLIQCVSWYENLVFFAEVTYPFQWRQAKEIFSPINYSFSTQCRQSMTRSNIMHFLSVLAISNHLKVIKHICCLFHCFIPPNAHDICPKRAIWTYEITRKQFNDSCCSAQFTTGQFGTFSLFSAIYSTTITGGKMIVDLWG